MLLLAASPILLTVALIAARRPALHAAVLGIVLTLAIIVWRFPLETGEIPALAGKWVPIVLEVFIIIGGGILLATANRVTGRQAELAGWVQQTVGSGTAAALAVVHGVAPFAESLTGFGIGVTVAFPLLLHLGFAPKRAVQIGLLGLCAVPWGAMGPGTLIAAALSGTTFKDVGVWSAMVSGPVFIVVGLAAAWLTSTPGKRVSALSAGALSGVTLWGTITCSNILFGSAPAGALGALLTFCLHLAVHKMRGAKLTMTRAQLASLNGYAVLLAGVMTLTVFFSLTGLKETPWHFLASPAIWLFVAVLTTTPQSFWKQVFASTMSPWAKTGSVTALFLVLGILMSISGMSLEVARGLEKFGTFYTALSPIIAGAGGYLTGSNSASNAMFSVPQAEAFVALGLPAVLAMGIQNTCASMLTMASPSRIELSANMCPEPSAAKAGVGTIYAVCAATMMMYGVLTFLLALLLV